MKTDNTMNRCLITKYANRFWDITDIVIIRDGDRKKYTVRFSYELTQDWILIYDCLGGQGTGYTRGDLIHKLYVGDCEVETWEKRELISGEVECKILS